MQACRVCLATNVRMHQLSEQKLSTMYARVTGVQINAEDTLPKQLCWECVARMSSAYHFVQKALYTQWILLMKMNYSGVLSMSDITSIDRSQHQLESRLSTNVINDVQTSSHIDEPLKEAEVKKESVAKTSKKKEIECHFTMQTFALTDTNFLKEKPRFTKDDDDDDDCDGDAGGASSDSNAVKDPPPAKDKLICDICNKQFRVKATLIYHIRKHSRFYNCNYCEYKSNYRYRVKRHVNTKHTKGPAFNCTFCSYVTYRKNVLDDHVNSQHTKKTSFNCTYCSYKTYRKGGLSLHINSQHTKATSFICSYCPYKTSYKSDLNKHVSTKHVKTTYTCTYCSFKTHRKSSLNEHINCQHTKSVSFSCTYCSFSTYRKGDLNKHVKSQHTKSTPYNCTYCSFTSNRKGDLNKHVNSQHTKNAAYPPILF